MANDSAFSETGFLGTLAELVGSATKVGLRFALYPLLAMKDLPFGLGGGVGRASASFPRVIGKAWRTRRSCRPGSWPGRPANTSR